MEKIKNLERINIIKFIFLILLAFVFSMGIRYIWIDKFQDVEQFKWNNKMMINTNDGYFYAEGARDIIKGFHQENDLSPIYTSLSNLTAFLGKILSVSFETLILWMPAVFGSLLVIPVLLIARALNQEYMGFVAALLAGIAWSYYNRTMIGYYDTDMLTIVLPTFILWSIIYNALEQRNRYLMFIPFFIMLSMWWYPQSYSLIIAMGVIVFLYTMVFERGNIFYYKMLVFMLIAIAMISVWIKLILISVLYLLFHFKKELFSLKILFILVGLSFLLVLLTGGFTPILNQIKPYIFREAIASNVYETMQLNYFAVAKTVREAGQIPFETFANRISGYTLTFVLSVIGYVLLSIRYKVMWLALPMVGLGFLALQGGLRFTVYAVPVMSLGIAYLIFLVANQFKHFMFVDKTLKVFKVGFVFLATIAILYPNIKHAQGYMVPTVFNKSEVQVLDALGKKAHREDYVISWWDYGYPIRYYSDVKTLIDGGKHTGKDNYAVSFTLLNNQVSGANMSRLEVEYTERNFQEHFGSNIIKMMKDYNTTNVNNFISLLGSKEFKLPKKTRDVYLYLPERMMNILPTVDLFSNLDLTSGQAKQRPFFYKTANFSESKNAINLGNNISLLKDEGSIVIGKKKIRINNFVVTMYDKSGILRKQVQILDRNSPISVIFMKNYHKFLVLDSRLYNSTYIQLFVLENYDKNLYEPVVMAPLAKVYKLKI